MKFIVHTKYTIQNSLDQYFVHCSMEVLQGKDISEVLYTITQELEEVKKADIKNITYISIESTEHQFNIKYTN